MRLVDKTVRARPLSECFPAVVKLRGQWRVVVFGEGIRVFKSPQGAKGRIENEDISGLTEIGFLVLFQRPLTV